MSEPPIPREVLRYLDTKYRRPKICREWLGDCCQWALGELEERGMPSQPPHTELINLIEDQLLKSELEDSMVKDTGLPENVTSLNGSTVLDGVPTLVAIVSVDEVGHSAFQLEQIRQAREERIQAGMDANGEGDEDADIEVEGEGPMPKYPQSMLSMILTDGNLVFKAFEDKKLPGLGLVQTPVGFKMQLKKVEFINGVAQLEPDNVILLGGSSSKNVYKNWTLKQQWRERMGLPTEPWMGPVDDDEDGENQDENVNQNANPPHPPPPAQLQHIRSPLQEITAPPSPAPQHNQHEDVEYRRRRVPSTSSTLLPNVSRSRLTSLVSSYFPPPDSKVASTSTGLSLSPTLRQEAPSLSPSDAFDDSFDFDMLDEMERTATAMMSTTKQPEASSSAPRAPEPIVNKPTSNPSAFPRILSSAPTFDGKLQLAPGFNAVSEPPKASTSRSVLPVQKPRASAMDVDSDDLFDGMDDSFGSDDLKQIEQAEREALAQGSSRSSAALPSQPSSSRDKGPQPFPAMQPVQRTAHQTEVITIDSDDDDTPEDKENMPVQTRHVRRRVGGRAGGASESAGMGSQMPPSSQPRTQMSSQRVGQKVLAPREEDIIDISD